MGVLRTSALLLGLCLVAPAAARAEPPPAKAAADREALVKEAAALNDEAGKLYEEGRYRAAVEKLERALRLDPGGKDLVYNLALAHEKLADFDEATQLYQRYLEMESDAKAKARASAALRRMEGARREKAERAPAAPPSGAAPIAAPAPPPPAPPRPVKPWVIATGAVAATAFLLGGIFALSAVARNPGSSPRTGEGVTIRELESDARVAHTHAMVADVSFLIAAAATGTATFLYFATPRSAPPPVAITVGPAMLRVRF